MGFKIGAYAKIWEIKNVNGKGFYQAKISTSKKKKDGSYETDFSDYVSFSGKASEKAKDLKGNERIHILEGDTTKVYYQDTGKTYYNFTIYDFEIAGANNSNSTAQNNSSAMNAPEVTEDEDVLFS